MAKAKSCTKGKTITIKSKRGKVIAKFKSTCTGNKQPAAFKKMQGIAGKAAKFCAKGKSKKQIFSKAGGACIREKIAELRA